MVKLSQRFAIKKTSVQLIFKFLKIAEKSENLSIIDPNNTHAFRCYLHKRNKLSLSKLAVHHGRTLHQYSSERNSLNLKSKTLNTRMKHIRKIYVNLN